MSGSGALNCGDVLCARSGHYACHDLPPPKVRGGLAVITRTGNLVHWPDVSARRHAQTFCGREWVNLHTPNASPSAVTCRLCCAALANLEGAES